MSTNTLHITDETGDTRVMWDPAIPDEVAAAEAAFKAGKKKGMMAYAVTPEGSASGEVIRDFDPERGKIIMVRRTAGG